jgi:small conductance mechanosensitive channel
VRNGEVVRVGNKSQGYARVVLDIPIAASDDVDSASAAIQGVAHQLREDADWAHLFLDDPVMEGVESLTLDTTVLRLVARVRPGEQWRVARELRRRIRERLARMNIEADVQTQNGAAAGESGAEPASP